MSAHHSEEQTLHDMTGLNVVMAGPLPPAIGGMATVIGDISQSSLADRVALVPFNTAKQTSEGRSLLTGIVARVSLWKRWASALRGKGQSVAHIHTCSGLTYFLDGTLLIIARLLAQPVVLHIHGARFDRFLDELPAPLLFLARWLARRANRVVVLSETWKETLTDRLPGAQLSVIANGVPVRDQPVEAENATQTVFILFLGNLSQRKGVWELIDAMRAVPVEATLALVGGEDDPGISDAVQTRINEAGMTDRVKLIGPAYGEDKHRWLEKADIFVLPSHAEGLPIALLEAMGGGIPAVVTAVGAMPTVINDGVQGKVVPPGDVDALSAALTALVNDPALRRTMGEAARKRCLADYGVERSAENYLRLYSEIVSVNNVN